VPTTAWSTTTRWAARSGVLAERRSPGVLGHPFTGDLGTGTARESSDWSSEWTGEPMNRWATTVFVLLVALACGGCGTDDEAAVFDALADRSGGGSELRYDTLADLLPNRLFPGTVGDAAPLMDLVVSGRVQAVRPGAAFANVDTADESRRVDYESPLASWRTVHLTVQPTEHFGGEEAGETIEVGMVIPPSLEPAAVERSLDDAEWLFFLHRDSAVLNYADDVFAIAGKGATLTEIEANGTLRLPVLGRRDGAQDEESVLLRGVETLDLFRIASEQPSRVADGAAHPAVGG
jgi:hypothetical protein